MENFSFKSGVTVVDEHTYIINEILAVTRDESRVVSLRAQGYTVVLVQNSLGAPADENYFKDGKMKTRI